MLLHSLSKCELTDHHPLGLNNILVIDSVSNIHKDEYVSA